MHHISINEWWCKVETGIDKAIGFVGSASALAKTLKVTKGAVHQWRTAGKVPAPRCPEIEKLTHRTVLCEELNGEIDWAYIRIPLSVDLVVR